MVADTRQVATPVHHRSARSDVVRVFLPVWLNYMPPAVGQNVHHLHVLQSQAQSIMCVQDIPLQKVLKAQSEAVEQIKGTLSTPGS